MFRAATTPLSLRAPNVNSFQKISYPISISTTRSLTYPSYRTELMTIFFLSMGFISTKSFLSSMLSLINLKDIWDKAATLVRIRHSKKSKLLSLKKGKILLKANSPPVRQMTKTTYRCELLWLAKFRWLGWRAPDSPKWTNTPMWRHGLTRARLREQSNSSRISVKT